MPTAIEKHAVSDAFKVYVTRLACLAEAVLDCRDSIEDASKVSVLAQQAAVADHDFWTALSLAHCDTFGIDHDGEEPNMFGKMIRPNAPSENSDDFAGWAKTVATDRTYGPIISLQAAE